MVFFKNSAAKPWGVISNYFAAYLLNKILIIITNNILNYVSNMYQNL